MLTGLSGCELNHSVFQVMIYHRLFLKSYHQVVNLIIETGGPQAAGLYHHTIWSGLRL